MTTVLLETAVEAILDALVARVTAATVPGQPLDAVRSVIRGDRARSLPELPSIWIVPETAVTATAARDGGRGIAETWSLSVRVAALVSSDDPMIASRECVRLAARARTEILRDRRLGLAYVADTTSTEFQPAAPSENNVLHWAAATVTVRFSTREEMA